MESFDRNEEIIGVSERHCRLWKRFLNCSRSLAFRLNWTTSFYALHIMIARNDHRHMAALHGFLQDEVMPGMELVEGTKYKNFHALMSDTVKRNSREEV